jgi:hypothetical protein
MATTKKTATKKVAKKEERVTIMGYDVVVGSKKYDLLTGMMNTLSKYMK